MSVKKNSVAKQQYADTISDVKKCLKHKILYPIFNRKYHVNERQHLLDLLKRTVELGESNSALLIGPRGCGKTILVDDVLNELSLSKTFKTNVIIVNLNGLIHTDDKLALKDITRQMELENVVENKVFGTFADNFIFLLDCLKSGDKKSSKPCIFVIEEFDLFCSHHNQVLIYNLFDVTQSSQAPVCVLGITCRIDVIELLEKRVKSRFSHRQIFLFPRNSHKIKPDKKNNKNISVFHSHIELFRDLLTITEHEVNKKFKITRKDLTSWNKHVDDLIRSGNVIQIIERLHQLDVSGEIFKNFLVAFVSILDINNSKSLINDFVEISKMYLHEDDKVFVLEGLSVLEFSLIIAMKHQTEIFDGAPFNFESIVARYLKFQSSSIQSVQKPVIMKAFEHLKNLELLKPVNNSTKTEKDYQFFSLLVTPQQILEAVKHYNGLPTEVAQWARDSFQ